MAYLLEKERTYFGKKEFIEVTVYAVPESVYFPQGLKYSLNYIRGGECILRYDNEKGKSHHVHFEGKELNVEFPGMEELKKEFGDKVAKIRGDFHESEERNNKD
ncbi:MAG TPA: DUF6516 family protein [archaeon]|nr:DUF6516 family protein [archaeon]